MIIVRSGGDIATGTIHRLHQSGDRVLVLECKMPTAIRRQVSFCEAVYQGRAEVEGVTCQKVDSIGEIQSVWDRNEVPLLVDPEGASISQLKPEAVIDGILAKRNLGTYRSMAPLTMALGPGFFAGKDVDYVIETNRGHRLGRIICEGPAMANTGIPGLVKGYGKERVIHAPADGVIHLVSDVGELVEKDQVMAWIGTVPVKATLTGILRGMIRDGFLVRKGLKIADIDPRAEELENCWLISDKARCIAGSVLEVLLRNRVYPGNGFGKLEGIYGSERRYNLSERTVQ